MEQSQDYLPLVYTLEWVGMVVGSAKSIAWTYSANANFASSYCCTASISLSSVVCGIVNSSFGIHLHHCLI